ncbi:MAG: transglutaminase-like domain-containing protein [Chloroflexota bacterium]
MWKKLFIVVSAMLLLSLIVSVNLWHQLELATASPVKTATDSGNTAEYPGSILARYTELRKEINQRAGIGDDRMSYITPDAPSVVALVQEITGGFSEDSSKYWQDVEKLYRWVPVNIQYRPDTYIPLLPEFINDELTWAKDYWRMPEETLRDREGDCEDMVALLVSMLLCYNRQEYSVWGIEIGNAERGHVAAALPVGEGMLIIFDPSIWYTTGPTDSVMGAKTLSDALNHWLARWGKELPGAEVRAVFSGTFCQEFDSTQEFLNWASRQ